MNDKQSVDKNIILLLVTANFKKFLWMLAFPFIKLTDTYHQQAVRGLLQGSPNYKQQLNFPVKLHPNISQKKNVFRNIE